MNIPELRFARYNVYIKTLEKMELPPFKGSMFRGAFGINFRETVCINKPKECKDCLLRYHCSYFKVFETELPDNVVKDFQGVKKVYHPYIINPPQDFKTSYMKEEIMKIGLTIFGDYYSLLPFFIFTFIKMGETGISYRRNKFELFGATEVDSSDNEHIIYDSGTGYITSLNIINKSGDFNYGSFTGKKATLEFRTPLRIIEDNVVVSDPGKISPEHIISSLQRRYYALVNFYCSKDNIRYTAPDFDKINISDNMLIFHNMERYSNRQKTKLMFGGFMGKITLEGEIADLMPLLFMGQFINIGKNTSFGLGNYKLIINTE